MRFERLEDKLKKIKRALLSVSDKTGLVELATALVRSGTELIATGGTAQALRAAGLPLTPIEAVSGSPEAYQGRMKTLSFPVFAGILYRRDDPSDEADRKRLGHAPIDLVVVNFYPFETRPEIETIDIGGPSLVRAAAKNVPQVGVLTHPSQYAKAIASLEASQAISIDLLETWASAAWDRIAEYDRAISAHYGSAKRTHAELALKYGENPHQTGRLEYDPSGPIAWGDVLTASSLSYNNILDLSAGYALMSELVKLAPEHTHVVILKHNNPCGVASAPGQGSDAQRFAFERAWASDPTSAFGGVVVFSHPLEEPVAQHLSERFIELVSAPELRRESASLHFVTAKRKNLKAVRINRWNELQSDQRISVPGGTLVQSPDQGLNEALKSVTKIRFPDSLKKLSLFGITVVRSLKSNAIAVVRQWPDGGLQLVGAGQGQPNRIDALESLAIPRARRVVEAEGPALSECVLVSDAFFPFSDCVEAAARAGITTIVQPGGSIRDDESVKRADELGVRLAFSGVRHFRH